MNLSILTKSSYTAVQAVNLISARVKARALPLKSRVRLPKPQAHLLQCPKSQRMEAVAARVGTRVKARHLVTAAVNLDIVDQHRGIVQRRKDVSRSLESALRSPWTG